MHDIYELDYTAATHAKLDGPALEGLRLLEGLTLVYGPFPAMPRRLAAKAIQRLPILDLREAPNEQAVADYTKVLANGDKLPPLTVLHIAGRFFLVDGHHRLAAFYQHARSKGRGSEFTVPVVYFEGSPAEAVFAAIERNAQHGVRLTTSERTDAAWRLILIGEKSRAEITRVTMVSRSRLGKMREVKRMLGDDAANHRSWLQALHDANGQGQDDLDEDGHEERKRVKAEKLVDQITREIGARYADDPELMAMVMDLYMGRRCPEFTTYLQRYRAEELAELAEAEANAEF